ncbi:unnamed protein product, partial [Polarella glacialis]
DICIIEDAAFGRNLACARRFDRGDLIFQSAPLGVAVRPRFANLWCAYCLNFHGDSGPPLSMSCKTCHHAHYCSETCRAAHASAHAVQCAALKVMSTKQLPDDAAILALWLADLWLPQGESARDLSCCPQQRSWNKPCGLHQALSGRCPGAQDLTFRTDRPSAPPPSALLEH